MSLYFPPTTVNQRDLYARSPFQVALLFFATLGLYIFWWSYRIRRSIAAMLEEPDQPVWFSVGLLVPLLNLYFIFSLFEKIKVASLRAGLKPPGALAAWGFSGILIFLVFGRFPLPYVSLAMLYFVPFAVAHFYFMHAELRLMGKAAIPGRFSILEIVILIAGLAFRGLIMIGSTFDASIASNAVRPGAWFSWLVLLVAIVSLVVIRLKGNALIDAILRRGELRESLEVVPT